MSTKDFIEKDYYKSLGVPKGAPQAEIKKSYRKLARQYHPDANKGDASSEERFKEISEAYDILSDEKRRKEYDEARALFGSGGFRVPGTGGRAGGPGGGGVRFDLGDLFGGGSGAGGAGGLGDLFGGLFGGAGGGGSSRGNGAPARGADVETEVTLDFDEATSGVTVPLRLASPHACSTCAGTGAKPGTVPRVCPTCTGTGVVSRNQGGFGFSDPCRECRGRGLLVDHPCPTCQGSGQVTSERTITVRIPPGVDNGQRIRLAGKGSPGDRGAPAGDLFVVVHVTPHRVFGRNGDNLLLTVPVTFAEAALGASVTVPTLGEPVTVKIPPGTSSGRTMRVRGRGVPRRDGTAGDLLVTVEVAVPKKLSAAAQTVLAAFAAETTDDPRAHLTELVSRHG